MTEVAVAQADILTNITKKQEEYISFVTSLKTSVGTLNTNWEKFRSRILNATPKIKDIQRDILNNEINELQIKKEKIGQIDANERNREQNELFAKYNNELEQKQKEYKTYIDQNPNIAAPQTEGEASCEKKYIELNTKVAELLKVLNVEEMNILDENIKSISNVIGASVSKSAQGAAEGAPGVAPEVVEAHGGRSSRRKHRRQNKKRTKRRRVSK